MASQLDICNSALIKLGGMPLVALDDGSKEGLLLSARYNGARDYVLREHPWKCAIKRVGLAPLTAMPLSDPNCLRQWQYAVQLPSDFLRLVLNDDDRLCFQIEGNTFLTNEQTIVIRYIWQVNNPVIFDSHVVECIAWYLAQDVSMSLIQNTAVSDRMTKQYLGFLSKAKFIDASVSRAITQNEYFYEQARLQANHI
jgi:hypothetical protein